MKRKRAKKGQAKRFVDYKSAFEFLYAHPIFRDPNDGESMLDFCWRVNTAWIDPKTNKRVPPEDSRGKTLGIEIECSPWVPADAEEGEETATYIQMEIDSEWTCFGVDFNTVVIALANRVYEDYGENGL